MDILNACRRVALLAARRAVSGVMPLVVVMLTVLVGRAAWGQIADDPSLPVQERRDITLEWLDQYLTESDLLRREDMDKIRTAVLQMSPSQLEQWLTQTKDLRAYVESEKWQETKKWLREFLRVQAMYSDAEIERLRNDIVNADAQQMLAIMKRIQSKHDSLVWMHQASEKSRQIAIRARDEDVAMQEVAKVATNATRQSDTSAVGNPQTGAAQINRNRTGYQVPGSLITSREVAQVAAWREAWGPMWFIGGL
ncbi:MAG: hypothetical protein ACYC3X_08975 [Pirellulaceae bacterium]